MSVTPWMKKVLVQWAKKLLPLIGLLVAASLTLSWFDTTSVELPEFSDPPIAYDHLADEKTDPFLVSGKPPVKQANRRLWADRQAVRRWPDVRSCLIRSERKVENPDLRKMDWGKMRRKEDVEVCLFRIAASLRSPEAMRDWFVSQGLQRIRIEMRKKLPNVYPEDMWVVSAGNSFSTGKTFRETPIPWRYWWMYFSRGESFWVLLAKDGSVFGVSYFDNNIL